jgi:CheY-like chemotaxis protein
VVASEREVWVEEVRRQGERLAADRLPREAGVLVACVMFGFFLPPLAVAAVWAFLLLTELGDYICYRAFAARPSRVLQAALLVNSAAALAAFSALGILVWNTGEPMLQFAAALSIAGALLNVSSARAIHLPLGLTAGTPPAAALIWLPAQSLVSGAAAAPAAGVATLAAVALVAYFLSALVQNHRAQSALAIESRRARHASAAKSRFLAEMSHEMRTPLNAILGLAGALRVGARTGDGRAQALDGIEDAAHRLTFLVGDALDLAAASEGRLAARPVPVDLRAELDAIARAIALSTGAGTPPEIAVAPGTPAHVELDPQLLRKAVEHLALAAAPRRPARIACATDGTPPRLLLTLTAWGEGPPEPARPLLREALAELARALGATVTEPSAAPGADGTLSLPLVPAPPLPPSGAAARHARVLVVDDIPTNRFVIVQLLRTLGHAASEADSGRSALAALAEGGFDIVLLDMNMPGMDGEATFRAIRTLAGNAGRTPVIALTADAIAEHRDRYLALGLDGYIAKPVDRARLAAEVARLLPGPAAAALSSDCPPAPSAAPGRARPQAS